MGHQKASDDVITVINVNSRLLKHSFKRKTLSYGISESWVNLKNPFNHLRELSE